MKIDPSAKNPRTKLQESNLFVLKAVMEKKSVLAME
jgi:hypothetical protein